MDVQKLKLANQKFNTKEARFEEFLKRYGREFELLTTVEGKVRFIKAEIGKMESILSKVEKESLIGQNAAYFDGAIMCKDYLEKELNKLEPPMTKDTSSSLPKLKWLGNPEQFGYIFGELVSKGYLELPTQNGEASYGKFADLCLSFYEIPPTKGKNKGQQTTRKNLERSLNPNKNNLSDAKGKKILNLPYCKDLK